MKNFCKISALSFGLSLLLFAIPVSGEAQFLKKINKGLEKVNKGLGNFNKKMDNLNQAASKQSDKQPVQPTEKAEQAAEKKAVQVHVDHTKAEPKKTSTNDLKLANFFRGNTQYMTVENKGNVTEAYEGIFAVSEKTGYSFWRVSGQQLFGPKWIDCGSNFRGIATGPRFGNGVCPMYSTERNAKGQRELYLLYADGHTKNLGTTYDQVSHFVDGLAIARIKGTFKYHWLNTQGVPQKHFPAVTGSPSNSIRPLCDNRRVYFSGDYNKPGMGYVDGNGTVVIPPGKYERLQDFSEGYAWVEDPKQKEWVLINTSGRIVLDKDFSVNQYTLPPSKVSCATFYTIKQDIERYTFYNYYDIHGTPKAQVYAGSDFVDGTAYIVRTGKLDCKVTVVDLDFVEQKEFEQKEFQGCEVGDIKYSPLKTAVYNDGWKSYILKPGGSRPIEYYHSDENSDMICTYDNFHPADGGGYARINSIRIDGKDYVGFMDLSGEIVMMISEPD